MAEGESSGNQGGIYAMLIIVVILILAVALYFSGMFGNNGGGGTDVDVNVETPALPDGDGGDAGR